MLFWSGPASWARWTWTACCSAGFAGAAWRAWARVSAKLTLWSGVVPPAVIAGAAVPGVGLMPAGSVETEGVAAAPPENFLMDAAGSRSEEHTSELQSLMRISYAVFCLKKQKKTTQTHTTCRKYTTDTQPQLVHQSIRQTQTNIT